MIKKILLYGITVLVALTVIALLLNIKLPLIQSFRIIFGLIFVVFLPGFIWSFVFFMKKSLDIIERATISIALSISLVSIMIFFSNKLGLRITVFNSGLEIVSIIFLAVIIIVAQKLNIAKKLYEKN